MPRFFAHRGSSHAFAENTRAAYLQAVRDGADGIECDVHLSADGHVVCHHDATLGRTSDGEGHVRELTLAQLRGFDYSGWKGAQIPPEFGGVGDQLCTLVDLVRIAQGAKRPIELAVETKHQDGDDPRLEPAVMEVLESLGFDRATRRIGDVSVSFMSFESRAVDRFLELVPREGVCTLIEDKEQGWEEDALADAEAAAAGPGEYRRRFVESARALDRGRAALIGPGVDFVRQHEDVVRGWLERASARVWTVDLLDDARYLLGVGVTELTSNRPAQLRAEVEAAGLA